MQQMYERLLAGQVEMFARLEEKVDYQVKATKQEEMLAEMAADRKADQEHLLERMDAIFGAYEKSIMACLGQAEVRTKKIEQDTEMMQLHGGASGYLC
jgi:hypothetical protein